MNTHVELWRFNEQRTRDLIHLMVKEYDQMCIAFATKGDYDYVIKMVKKYLPEKTDEEILTAISKDAYYELSLLVHSIITPLGEQQHYISKEVCPGQQVVAFWNNVPIGVVGIFCVHRRGKQSVIGIQSMVSTPSFMITKALFPNESMPKVNEVIIPFVKQLVKDKEYTAIIVDPLHRQKKILMKYYEFVEGNQLQYRIDSDDSVVASLIYHIK